MFDVKWLSVVARIYNLQVIVLLVTGKPVFLFCRIHLRLCLNFLSIFDVKLLSSGAHSSLVVRKKLEKKNISIKKQQKSLRTKKKLSSYLLYSFNDTKWGILSMLFRKYGRKLIFIVAPNKCRFEIGLLCTYRSYTERVSTLWIRRPKGCMVIKATANRLRSHNRG